MLLQRKGKLDLDTLNKIFPWCRSNSEYALPYDLQTSDDGRAVTAYLTHSRNHIRILKFLFFLIQYMWVFLGGFWFFVFFFSHVWNNVWWIFFFLQIVSYSRLLQIHSSSIVFMYIPPRSDKIHVVWNIKICICRTTYLRLFPIHVWIGQIIFSLFKYTYILFFPRLQQIRI